MHDNSKDDSKGSRSGDPNSNERIMIEIRRPGEKLDMPDIVKLLEGTGAELDPSYGPFLVNPSEGRHVVRGIASPGARKSLKP